jgi:hypothetical protein
MILSNIPPYFSLTAGNKPAKDGSLGMKFDIKFEKISPSQKAINYPSGTRDSAFATGKVILSFVRSISNHSIFEK